jgi:hypothetical protein
MRSFRVAIEPCEQPRLAAAAVLAHGLAASAPWIARVAAPLAIALTLLALAGLVMTLARVPGRHSRLAALVIDAQGCRARLAEGREWLPARLSAATRAFAPIVSIELEVGGRRLGWLLPRSAVPHSEFRRLKARIRLTC